MPTPGPRTTSRYSDTFKATAVRLSQLPGVSVRDVAESLYIHPFMLSRWRKEYREGKFGMPTSKKEPKPEGKLLEQDEIKRLKRRVAELEEENDILKKWRRFQAEERRKNSAS